MSNQETFDLSELEAQYTERELVSEATAKATVRKGNYKAVVKSFATRVAGPESPFPGRKMLSLQLGVQDDTGKTITLFQDVSWEVYRELSVAGQRVLVKPGDEGYDNSLKMDKPARMWGMLEKLFNEDGTMSIPEVVRAIVGSQVGIFVMEGFMSADGNQIQWPESRPNDYSSYAEYVKAYDKERTAFASQGLTPKNFISNFHKPKE